MRQTTCLFLAVCIGAACAAVAAGQDRQRRAPVDRTTPILKKMTPAQREHAKLYNGRGHGTRLLDEGVNIIISSDSVGRGRYSAREIITRAACDADAVIAGVVSTGKSYPSEDGGMLFTEYDVLVTEVLRRSEKLPTFSAANVTVARVGGKVTFDGQTIKADLQDTPMLEQGLQYLLFLRLLPKYGTFQGDAPSAAWAISEAKVRALAGLSASDAHLITEGIDVATTIDWVRGASCRQ